jgi:hypothetical protein
MHNADVTEAGVLKLLGDQAIFIGFKMDTSLVRQIESLPGPHKRYVSTEDSEYLRICRLGDARYLGKLIHERLTTERVDDIRRNIHSILGRICPETRLPQKLAILACSNESEPFDPPRRENW